jgi:hypothetical protein
MLCEVSQSSRAFTLSTERSCHFYEGRAHIQQPRPPLDTTAGTHLRTIAKPSRRAHRMAQHSLPGHGPPQAPHRASAPDGTDYVHSDTLPPLYSLSQNESHITVNHGESQVALNKLSLKFTDNVKVSTKCSI